VAHHVLNAGSLRHIRLDCEGRSSGLDDLCHGCFGSSDIDVRDGNFRPFPSEKK